MNLHRKSFQDGGKNQVAGEPQAAHEEIAKHDNFIIFGGRSLLVYRSTPGARGEKSRSLVFSDQVRGNLGFPEDKGCRKRSPGDQISDAYIDISEVFFICPNFAILTAPGTTGGGRASIFGRRSILRTLDDWFDWETAAISSSVVIGLAVLLTRATYSKVLQGEDK
jgi:hypothetical protein